MIIALQAVSSIFGMVGTAILYRYGIAATIDTGGLPLLTDDEIDPTELAQTIRYKRLSRLGLAFLFASFALNMASLVIA